MGLSGYEGTWWGNVRMPMVLILTPPAYRPILTTPYPLLLYPAYDPNHTLESHAGQRECNE